MTKPTAGHPVITEQKTDQPDWEPERPVRRPELTELDPTAPAPGPQPKWVRDKRAVEKSDS